jgi:hypothetical protein
MAICGCGLPARCCQPAVSGGIIYADLWGELNIPLALQALFTQSSPVCEPLLQAFPFPSTLGEVTLHPLSQADVFIYSSSGKWVFPPSCGVFLSLLLLQAFLLLIAGRCCCSCRPACLFTAHMGSGSSPRPVQFSCLCHSHKLSCSWLLGVCHHSRSLQPGPACLFTVLGGIPLPQCFGAQGAPPSLLRVFIVLIAYYSVSLFSPSGGQSVQWGYADLAQGCLWNYCVPLSSPCPHLPKLSGCWRLAARGPSWFLRST